MKRLIVLLVVSLFMLGTACFAQDDVCYRCTYHNSHPPYISCNVNVLVGGCDCTIDEYQDCSTYGVCIQEPDGTGCEDGLVVGPKRDALIVAWGNIGRVQNPEQLPSPLLSRIVAAEQRRLQRPAKETKCNKVSDTRHGMFIEDGVGVEWDARVASGVVHYTIGELHAEDDAALAIAHTKYDKLPHDLLVTAKGWRVIDGDLKEVAAQTF